MNSIITKKLAIAYEKNIVVENLNLEIPKGKITTIIGSNGCGKSTILKAIGRIIKPIKGSIYINGIEISQLNTKEIAKQMAILPQAPQGPPGLTVGELIGYGRFPHQKASGLLTKKDKAIVLWALKVTNLQDLEARPLDKLSEVKSKEFGLLWHWLKKLI